MFDAMLLGPVGDSEIVGRHISDDNPRYIRPQGINFRAFFRKGESELSVDRLEHVSDSEMAQIADTTLAPFGYSLLAWAEITVVNARQNGREVEADELTLPPNPYCALIKLPLRDASGEERRDVARSHAVELAAQSKPRMRS